MIDNNEAIKNINDFMEKHGEEGFLNLFFKEYLYNLIENEIASKGDKISNDYGILRYRGKKIRNRSELNKYSYEIKTECGKKAEEIVKDLKQNTNLTNMLEGDFGKLDEKFYEETMKEKMHELFRRWEKEDEG